MHTPAAAIAEPSGKLVSMVMQVNDDVAYTVSRQLCQDMVEYRLQQQRQQGFGTMIGERSHSRTQASGKNHRFHGSCISCWGVLLRGKRRVILALAVLPIGIVRRNYGCRSRLSCRLSEARSRDAPSGACWPSRGNYARP